METHRGKYDQADVKRTLEYRGVRFRVEQDPITKTYFNVADASKMDVVGIDTHGKLDYLMNHLGYTIYLPVYSFFKVQ